MWRVVPGQSLAFKEWDGEAVLYNDLSGNTHLLDGAAVEVLAGAAPGPRCRHACGPPWPTVRVPMPMNCPP
jgi:hypothetical protein